MSVPSHDTSMWVNRLLSDIDSDQRQRLANDTEATIHAEFGLPIDMIPDMGEDCPIHGSYFRDRGITVVATRSVGRIRFSLLHELAHHLIDTVDFLDLVDHPDSAQLEEAICNSFAASILLPIDLIDEHIPDSGPTSAATAALWQASPASRATACVAAANRLQTPGYVMLADLAGIARFTATHGTPYRVAADVPQGSSSIIRKAVERNGSAHGETTVRFATGNESPTMYGDATVVGNYVFAVIARTQPGATFTASVPQSGTRHPRPCPYCDESFVRWDDAICRTCSTHKCPHCERCECPYRPRRDASCSICGLVKPEHIVQAGTCIDCQ